MNQSGNNDDIRRRKSSAASRPQRSVPPQRSNAYRTASASSGRRLPSSSRPQESRAPREYPNYQNSVRRAPSSPSSAAPHKPDNDGSSKKKKKKKKKNPFVTFLKVFMAVFFIVCFACAGGAIGAYLGIIKNAPELDMITVEPNAYTSIIYDKDGNEIDRLHGDENREYVVLADIPKNMQNAIIAIEDERFYSHNGIDLKGIVRAAYVTLKNKITGQTGLEGASTITQQLIKNNVTKVSRNTMQTKLQEQYLAVKYEKELEKQLGSKKKAKDYILELYLNTISLHHGYNGVQTAAIGYFGKDVSELDLAECACIAGITNNPSRYTPRNHPENNKERQKKILKNMLEQGYISQMEHDNALDEDIYSHVSENSQTIQNTSETIHSYYVDSLFEQISDDLQEQYNMSAAQANNILYKGGLEITAAIDTSIQKVVDEAYKNEELFPKVTYNYDVTYTVSVENTSTGKQNHSEYKQFVKTYADAEQFAADKRAEIEAGLSASEQILDDKVNIVVEPQSAMLILDYHEGYVRALAGGRGDKLVNMGFNRAVDSARQPGSVFKVLAAFAPGIDLGKLTPATVFDDVPYTVGGYSPSNWYSGYRGLSTVREGIKNSMNIVAVRSMVYTGIEACYDYLLNFGFTTLEDDDHAATALGGLTNGVTQLEVTAAFGTIANQGAYKRPMFYQKVLDHDGNVLLENNSESKQVLKKTSAFLLTDMMKDVITGGTGTKARFVNSSMPVAGKTGTTQESRDLTFVGYTPYYAAGIWLGYDRYDDTVNNMSSLNQSIHLTLWRSVMEKIHENLTVKDFDKPEGIVSASICTESGMLAASLCSQDSRGTVRTEYFAEGTQPTQYCSVHRAVTICKDSGMTAGEYCPEESRVTSVGIVRPEPYNGTASIDDRQYEVGKGAVCNIHNSENSGETTEAASQSGDAGSEGVELPDVNAGDTPPAQHTEATTDSVSIGEIIPSVPEEPVSPPEQKPEPETNAPPAEPIMPDDGSISIDDPVSVDGFNYLE